MIAKQLIVKLSSEPGTYDNVDAWICGKCNTISYDKDISEQCCICTYCKKVIDENTRTRCWRSHSECQNRAWRDRDAKTMADAELVDWDGDFIYFDDRMYDAPEDIIDGWCDTPFDEMPTRIHATDKTPFAGIDIEDVIFRAVENMDENATDRVMGYDELSKAIDKFNVANLETLTTYDENYKQAIDLTEYIEAAKGEA